MNGLSPADLFWLGLMFALMVGAACWGAWDMKGKSK